MRDAPFDWSELAELTVLVTASFETAGDEIARLTAAGATTIHIPLIEVAKPADRFATLDAAIAHLPSYDWIAFTSRSAVKAFAARLGERALPLALNVAAVGPGTAEAIAPFGWPVSAVAGQHDAEGLLRTLKGLLKRGDRVLWPRARDARPLLADGLRAEGIAVDDVEAYATRIPEDVDGRSLARIVERAEADAVLFDSPSAVRHFVALVGCEGARRFARRARIIPIGPLTAQAIREEIGPG